MHNNESGIFKKVFVKRLLKISEVSDNIFSSNQIKHMTGLFTSNSKFDNGLFDEISINYPKLVLHF